jgi:hypothetical protein
VAGINYILSIEIKIALVLPQRDAKYAPIKLYPTPVPCCDAPPPGLPCHTCGRLSLPSVEHLNHHRPSVLNRDLTCSAVNGEFPCSAIDRELSCSAIS